MSTPPQQMTLSVGLRDDATFDNFYVGGNGLVVDATQQVAIGGDEPYIYLWGANGSGGSHLLQAACHEAAANGRSSLYLPLQQVAEHGPQVLESLEAMDLVCLDHLQAVAGDAAWEEGLFHLYNRIRDLNGALIVTADQPPRQLPVRLPDLQSRLGWGAVFQLQPLEDRDKIRALCLRADVRGFQLGEETAQFILHRSPRDMGALFQLLDQLDIASLRDKRKVTIPFIKQTLDW